VSTLVTWARPLPPDESRMKGLLHDLGQLDLAKAELSAAVEALTRVLGADHPSTLRHRGHLADLLRDLGGTGEADHNA
jgi:hypothetical protein